MGTTILLIDDDARILQTFARVLKLAGYILFTAEEGATGLELYRQEQPDIVLLDLRMPGMDGLEVLKALRAHDPEANVILATGHGDKDAVIEALRAGASDFLSKPIDQISLESALRRAEERIVLKRKLRASQEALHRQNEQLEATVQSRTEELRKSEARYRRLAENSPDMIYRISLPDGTYEYVSPASTALTGYAPERWYERPFLIQDILPPKWLAYFEEEWGRLLEGNIPPTYEYQIVHRDGSVRWINQRNVLVMAENGRPIALEGTLTDITERKHMEEAILDERERLNTILSSLDTGLSLINPDMTIAWVNQKVYDMFPGEDPVGQMCHLFYESRDTLCENCGTLAAFKTGKPQVRERRNPSDGHWYMIISEPVKDENGNVVNVLEGITDITERKQATEDQKRRVTELNALNAMTTIVNQSLDPDEIFNRTVDEVLRQFGVEAAAIMLLDEATGELVMTAHRGVSEDFVARFSRMKLGEGLSGRVAQTGESAVIRDLTEYPEMGRVYLEREQIQSAASVPLVGSNGPIGVMTLAATRSEYFNKKSLDLLVGLGQQIAVGLEKARLYKTVRAREALLSATGQMAKVGGWEFDVAASELRWSDQVRRIHQVPMDYQPRLEDALAFFPLGDREKLRDAFQAAIEEGTPYDLELRFVTAQGKPLWVRTIGQPEVVNGTTRKLTGTFQDITDRRGAEEALRKSEERFRMTIHRSPIGVGMVDHTGQLTDCNVALAEMVGYTREELISLNFEDFTHPDDLEREWQLINDLWDGETPEYRMEKRYIHKDGHTIWVDVAASLFKDEAGELAFGFAFVQDITERKQAEAKLQEYAEHLEELVEEKVRELDQEREKIIQLDKMAALGELATGVAHELNQPLASILFDADYLKAVVKKATERGAPFTDLVTPDDLQRIGDNIGNDVKRCNLIINHLRDLGRISEEPPTPIHLNHPINESFILVGARLRDHDVDVRLDLANDLPPIMAHSHKLEQVFLNMISNAEYALDQRAAEESSYQKVLEITTEVTGSEVIATVRDNGCGIPDDVRERIFDPFFTTKPLGEGTGLGLSISYNIVANYDGEITCESVEGEGTTFTLRFPIADADQGEMSRGR